MHLLVIVALTAIALISSVGVVVWAVLVTRWSKLGVLAAASYALGWIFFIWPFPILSYVASAGADSRTTASVSIIAGLSALVGAFILTVRFLVSSAPKRRQETLSYYLHWLGMFLVITAGVIFAMVATREVWPEVITATVGLALILGARIVNNHTATK